MATARKVSVRSITADPEVDDLGPSEQTDFDTRVAAAPAIEAAAQTARANGATLRQRGRDALAANATFLALPAAQQAAQAATQIVRLTRQNSALIRLVLGAR